MAFGIDYSYGSGLSAGRMKAAGVRFVCRYLSWQPNSKCINKSEFDNLTGAGLYVVLVWEGTGRDLVNGFRGGAHDATEANRQAGALGAHGIPLYFAPADYDVPEGDQSMFNNYLDGAASVIGRARTGAYGGYWPLKRAFDAGKCHYGWQTYAWSGGNVDHRAALYQYQNGAHMGPAEVDFDKSFKIDFGQWPRPKVTAPPAKPVAPPPVPPHKPGDPYLHHAPGDKTFAQIAHDRGTTAEHLWQMLAQHATPADIALIGRLVLPKTWPYYTTHP